MLRVQPLRVEREWRGDGCLMRDAGWARFVREVVVQEVRKVWFADSEGSANVIGIAQCISTAQEPRPAR